MTTRQDRQDSYTEKGELEPLTWGRLKIARRAIDAADEEDYPDIAAALYFMTFEHFRTLPRDKFVGGCCKFAQRLPAAMVVEAGLALSRDMGAIQGSEVIPADDPEEGKDAGVVAEVDATPPQTQPSLVPR